MALGFMSICAVIFFLEGRTLAGWFIESDRVVSIATGLLIVACFFQIADGTQVVMLSALRGMGDVRLPTIIAGFAYWLITLPLGYLLAFRLNLGPKGIWIGLAAGLSIAAALFAGRFLVRTRPLNC